jgi:hypothetical protein
MTITATLTTPTTTTTEKSVAFLGRESGRTSSLKRSHFQQGKRGSHGVATDMYCVQAHASHASKSESC